MSQVKIPKLHSSTKKRKLRSGSPFKTYSRKIYAVDLFAGAGGLSLGFKWAGFPANVKVEVDESCFEVLSINFPEAKIIEDDIRKVSIEDIRSALNILPDEEVDFVIGGPPCGFSLIGLRDPNDPRSGLIYEYSRIVKGLRPKFFVMENVPGMLSASDGQFVEQLLKIFEESGYKLKGHQNLEFCRFWCTTKQTKSIYYWCEK